MADLSEGWGVPGRSNKFHYFRGGRSLCEKWGFYRGPLDPDTDSPSKDDCTPCRKKRDKEKVTP